MIKDQSYEYIRVGIVYAHYSCRGPGQRPVVVPCLHKLQSRARALERKSVIIMSRFGIDCSTPARLPPKNVPIMVICVLDRLGGVGGGCGCGVGFINLSFPRCIEIGFNVHTCSHQIA